MLYLNMENNLAKSSVKELDEKDTSLLNDSKYKKGNRKPKTKSSPYAKRVLLIFAILFGFILSGVAGYILGSQKCKQKSDAIEVSDLKESSTPTLQPLPTDTVPETIPTTEPENEWTMFTHPTAGYKMGYPTNWTKELFDIPGGSSQKYESLSIKSPDYRMFSDGYPFLEKGAQFFIQINITDYSTIDEIFNNNPLAPQIAFDIKITTVDDLEAIQYDYSYESSRATMTEFTKDNYHYIIKYQYVDDESRQDYWEEYQKLLTSFKID